MIILRGYTCLSAGAGTERDQHLQRRFIRPLYRVTATSCALAASLLSACRKNCKFQMIRLEFELCCSAFYLEEFDNWFEFLHWNLIVSSCYMFHFLDSMDFLSLSSLHLLVFSCIRNLPKYLVKPRQWSGLFSVISLAAAKNSTSDLACSGYFVL